MPPGAEGHGRESERSRLDGHDGRVFRVGGLLRQERPPAPAGELLARRGGGGAEYAAARLAQDLRARSCRLRAGDGDPARPGARRGARAPPGAGSHAVGAEVGVTGGVALRQSSGAGGPRRGGQVDPRLGRGSAVADARLRPGDEATPPGCSGRSGGGGVPAPDEPEPGPAAAHALHPRQHDAEPGRGVAERGAHGDPPQREADRRLLPPGAGPEADRAGLPHRDDDDRRGSGLRDRGLPARVAGYVLDAAPRDPCLAGRARPSVQRGADAAGGADHPQAQGRQGPRHAEGGVEGAGGGDCPRPQPCPAGSRARQAPVTKDLQGPSLCSDGTGAAARASGAQRPRGGLAGGGTSRGARVGIPGERPPGDRAEPCAGPAWTRGDRRGGDGAAGRRPPGGGQGAERTFLRDGRRAAV